MEPLITMTGRVGQDPVLRFSKKEVPFTRFRMAHTPRLFRDGAWIDGETSWVTVLCFNRLAENVCRSFKKGHPVVVTGRARVETWADETNRLVRESLTIDARSAGHDLMYGFTTFSRVAAEPEDIDRPKELSPEDPPCDDGTVESPEAASAEGAASTEVAREVVDPATGELLEPAPF